MRFHLVSLVAVFLALGIGLAMGASFIDRATVDTLQNRVDDLGNGFIDRGKRIDTLGDQLTEVDESSAALTAPGSPATAGHLDGQSIVMVVPENLPDGSVETTVEAIGAAGATVSGAVRLRPAFGLTEASDRTAVARRLGVAEKPRDALASRMSRALADALATLSAAPPGAEPAAPGPTTGPGTTTTAPTTGETTTVPPVTDVNSARALLSAYAELGLLVIDPLGTSSDAAFPQRAGVRYVFMTGADSSPASDPVVDRLVADYGALSSATALVAEALPDRPDGGPLPEGSPEAASTLGETRTGTVADAVSTVDSATEPLGRLSVVYTIEALVAGRVGHYGTGPAASAPFPTVPPG